MLPAYTNFRTEACVKCGKHVDRNGILPAVRRKQPRGTKRNAAVQETKWLAFHEHCQP
jgi:hypothetical protein